MKREKSNYMIQSVSHALDVLEELCKAAAEIGVTELSKRLKLHKNNVFRLLATLELRGYVEQNKETEDYRLGVRALQLGQSYLVQSSLVARALPVLKSLSEATGETASLAILQGGSVQFPVSVESKRPVKVAGRIAVSFPAKMSAVGRLLTAQMPDAALAELLASNTAQDAAIKSQLGELRSTGMVMDRGATEADVLAVSRVVRGVNSEIIGAIEVLGPQYRAKTDLIIPKLEEAAQALSTSLGSMRSALIASVEREISSPTQSPASPMPPGAGGINPAMRFQK
jgi:IclR family transcriptional regulator, KDG regulon repressor